MINHKVKIEKMQFILQRMNHPTPYVHKGLHILRMPKMLVEDYDDIQEGCEQVTLQYPCIPHSQCYQPFLRYQMVSLSCIHVHIKSRVEFLRFYEPLSLSTTKMYLL